MPYQESDQELSDEARDYHRAIESLKEELEAIDCYNQRLELCGNVELQSILAHNGAEEKEHAAMLIEWLRRVDSVFGQELENYLFSQSPIED